ncbi:MAG: hypothetical protein V2I26_17105 [Halieaceae bacterium]|jgi:hypothetical protein|nr:hypothetical protein [Halieaceae bacterium]
MRHAAAVRTIMRDFARSTGLSDTSHKPRRYLWTDAFAVCNFLELYRETGEDSYLQSARELVQQVHVVLGRFSDEDSRRGWISGLDEQAGYQHPTLGGLRIGKTLAEREPDEPFDDRLEWDRDGQYFHYLTKWMQALGRMAAVTGELHYQQWALELAGAAHAGFTCEPIAGGQKRMYWKMSVDLSRPLVASMGHHDPLDALITYMELRANSRRLGIPPGDIALEREIAEAATLCARTGWATHDPLGTGGLMVDSYRLAQIQAGFDSPAPLELAQLLADAHAGLAAFVHSGLLDQPAQHRLAFRELGLAIGLHALARLRKPGEEVSDRLPLTRACSHQLEKLAGFAGLAEVIENFWLQPSQQQVATWRDHLDINRVMLATSLAPDTYLAIFPGNASPTTESGTPQ